LEEKVAVPIKKAEDTAVGIRHADYTTPLYPQKLALTSPTSDRRSVRIVRSWTEVQGEFGYYLKSFTGCKVRITFRKDLEACC
jgi:hypothetical protein